MAMFKRIVNFGRVIGHERNAAGVEEVFVHVATDWLIFDLVRLQRAVDDSAKTFGGRERKPRSNVCLPERFRDRSRIGDLRGRENIMLEGEIVVDIKDQRATIA